MRERKFLLISVTALFVAVGLCAVLVAPDAGATNYPWLSWRHDLQNTGAAPDTGYPTTANLLWNQTQPLDNYNGWPARVSTPCAVGNNIVIATGNDGIITARDQVTGNLIWSKQYLWLPTPPTPSDAPPNWCQGSDPNIYTNIGICGYKINGVCPDWCYQCSDTPFDCNLDNQDNY